MLSLVKERVEEVRQICRRLGVERLDLFGSAAGERFDPADGDLDFVVSFEQRDPPALLDRYFGLKEDLETRFGRGVDVLTVSVAGYRVRVTKSIWRLRA